MERFSFYNELILGLSNGFLAYVGLLVIAGITAMVAPPHTLAPSLPWLIVGIAIAFTIIFVRNIGATPKRIAFVALRTVAHLLVGIAAPPALFLVAILLAPHGMNAFPRFGPILAGLFVPSILGLVLMRWVVVPRRAG